MFLIPTLPPPLFSFWENILNFLKYGNFKILRTQDPNSFLFKIQYRTLFGIKALNIHNRKTEEMKSVKFNKNGNVQNNILIQKRFY